MKLVSKGWNSRWQTLWDELGEQNAGLEPARIASDHGSRCRVVLDDGECWAEPSGRLRHAAETGEGLQPAVGDWVAVRRLEEGHAVIMRILPRSSVISRRAAGSVPAEQVVAANVDNLFLVSALNDDFNVRRMERYLIMAWNSGASPVVLLTKSDLCPDAAFQIAEMEAVAPGVPVLAVSAHENIGGEALQPYLGPGRTIALTGSSGCGKSTLVNWLCGRPLQRVQEVRLDDSKGRHTTTHRELFELPSGGVIIDTPGMRELQLWEDGGGLNLAFADIEQLAAGCRFADCRHEREAGCAVLEAVAAGGLEEKRLLNYRKTQRELAYYSAKEVKAKRTVQRGKQAKSPKPRARDWKSELE